MSKRPLILACAAASLLVACSSIPNGTVVPGTGSRFVSQVVDSVDNVGLGNAISLDKDGVPYISYWGFPAVLKPGEIAPSRPIGSPFIPAVQVSSLAKSGIWTHGAAAESEFNGVSDVQARINIPFGPVTQKALADATPANTNGTDIAVAADGTEHVVWTARDGVYYGSEPSGGSFAVDRIYSFGVALDVAGPIGRASVALDASGTPWVAYAVNAAQQEVRIATLDANGKWQTSIVATLPRCGGCPQPGVTGIGITDKGDPVVAYVDGRTKAVVVATPGNGDWATQTVASGVTGGLSLAVGKSGSMYITYYKSDGTIQLASDTGSGWATAKVGDAAPPPAPEPTAVPSTTPAPTVAPSPTPTPTSSAGASTTPTPTPSPSPVINAPPAPQTTGVAVDDNGKVYVAWYDGDSNAVQLVSGDGTTFTPIQTTGTVGGRYPALAVAPDGSFIYLTWYDNDLQDLLLGIWGNQPSYQIAYPSPTAALGTGPSQGPVTCGSDKKPILDITAQSTTWSTACLVAAARQPFTISVDNKDSVSVTGPHDLAIYKTSADAPANPIVKTDPINGPATAKLDVGSLAPGSYYFQCDFHPTLMTGRLVVVAGAK